MSITDEFKKVQKTLSKLPHVLQEKVVVGATRAAAKTIADDAKRRVPVKSGLLKKSIGVKKAKKQFTPDNVVKYIIAPMSKVRVTKKVIAAGKSGKLKASLISYHGGFVEFGTKNMKAKPYLAPAMRANRSKAVKAFQSYAILRTEKELRKLA